MTLMCHNLALKLPDYYPQFLEHFNNSQEWLKKEELLFVSSNIVCFKNAINMYFYMLKAFPPLITKTELEMSPPLHMIATLAGFSDRQKLAPNCYLVVFNLKELEIFLFKCKEIIEKSIK